MAILVASLCLMTLSRNALWNDSIALWTDIVVKSPRKAKAYNNLAFAYSAAGEIDKAIDHYRIALRLEPDNAATHFNLGVIYIGRGMTGEARKAFEACLRIDPAFIPARRFLDYLSAELNAGSTGRTGPAGP